MSHPTTPTLPRRLVRRRPVRFAATTAAAVTALVLPIAAPVAAAPPTTLAKGLAGPLGLAVGRDGTVYVAESNAGRITAIATKGGGTRTVVATGAGLSTAGVDVARDGTLTYTVSREAEAGTPVGLLNEARPDGRVRTLADLAAFEKRVNPDKGSSYGFRGLTKACQAKLPENVPGAPYGGDVNSNPYAVELLPHGVRVVADAGGNDIVRVGRRGKVGVIAVLPRRDLKVTAAIAKALELPGCTVGKTFGFEPVPTDVERGPDGLLYVTSLPGGPEGPVLGARGAVFSVDPHTGKVRLIASGFLGATDLAVAPNGTIYVTELFGDRIALVRRGRVTTLLKVKQPAAIEYAKGKLYATTDALGPKGEATGKVITLTP